MAPDYPIKGAGARKKLNPKAALARAVETFMKAPFPERSSDEDADLLHAELLLFDSSVGDAVMAIVNGEHVPMEDLRPNRDLRARLEQMVASDNATAAADARGYLDYLDGLEQLQLLALEAIGKRPKR